MTTKIFVATHKKYRMPRETMYQPIFVGADLNGNCPANYIADNTQNNISSKNPNFNELTGLYWIWKNDHSEIKGLVHYRRYFSFKPRQKYSALLNEKQINESLAKANIIVPRKRHYWIESNYSHYIHAHKQEPLDLLGNLIASEYPDYLPSFHKTMQSRSAHMFNMFIMPNRYFDEYCKWLFSVLFSLESKLDISEYNPSDARVFGYLSELLLDTWINKNEISVCEVPITYIEGTHYFKKGINLLTRKFFPKMSKKTHF